MRVEGLLRAGLLAVSALGAIATGSTGASAQVQTQTPGCSASFPPSSIGNIGPVFAPIIGGVLGATNSISSVIGTMNTSFVAQGNAFVAGLPNPTPDETADASVESMLGRPSKPRA